MAHGPPAFHFEGWFQNEIFVLAQLLGFFSNCDVLGGSGACTNDSRARKCASHTPDVKPAGRITTMTLLKAIVRPTKVDAVRKALDEIGVGGMTVSEVAGRGKEKALMLQSRGTKYEALRPKVSIDVVVADGLVSDVKRAIIQAARTGEIGDGRIFEIPLANSYSIRTGEVAL